MARFLAFVMILALVSPVVASFSAQPASCCCCGSRTCPMRMMACKTGSCAMHKAVESLFPSLPPALMPDRMLLAAQSVTMFAGAASLASATFALAPPDPPPPRLG